jgi:hypothetical protein
LVKAPPGLPEGEELVVLCNVLKILKTFVFTLSFIKIKNAFLKTSPPGEVWRGLKI